MGWTISIEERDLLIRSICQQVADGTLGMPDAIRRLRVEVTGLNQAHFAKRCKSSYAPSTTWNTATATPRSRRWNRCSRYPACGYRWR